MILLKLIYDKCAEQPHPPGLAIHVPAPTELFYISFTNHSTSFSVQQNYFVRPTIHYPVCSSQVSESLMFCTFLSYTYFWPTQHNKKERKENFSLGIGDVRKRTLDQIWRVRNERCGRPTRCLEATALNSSLPGALTALAAPLIFSSAGALSWSSS